jgi:PAS domain S-box-containing protein
MNIESLTTPLPFRDMLIVDDNPENLKVLGDFFSELGYTVRIARDGQQALDNALAAPPEIILLDIHMPVMDGYDACTKMKALPELADIPVIFLSALSETFNKVRAFECGGADYITKPFNLHEVRVRVETQLLTMRLLAESKAGFKASFEQSAVGMAHLSRDGVFTAVNRKLCRVLGYEPHQLLGAHLIAFVGEDSHERLMEALHGVRGQDDEQEALELPCVHAGGATVYCRSTFSLVEPASGNPYIAAIMEDVTAHKALASERSRLAAALEQSAEAIAITCPEGKIQYVNAAYKHLFGEPEGGNTGRILPILASDDNAGNGAAGIWNTISAGDNWTGRITHEGQGGKARTEEYLLSPVRLESGAITNYVAVARDVTRQLRLEEQLRQAQKMEAIGTLAAGIAHDFNNILTAIIGYTQLAMRDVDEEHPAQSDLREVLSASGHATELVRQILGFARQATLEIRPVRLQLIAEDSLKLLRRSIPPTIEFNVQLETGCRPVMADDTAIRQILMNLCTNAYHAMEDKGGALSVLLSEVAFGEESAHVSAGLEPGAYARLDVIDSGCGMDQETTQRIFEPYFTTKERGAGTGLGLATVHGIVSDLKGAINVYSEPGSGSTFTIFLPIADGAADAARGEMPADSPCPGSERILFVDDDRAICNLANKAMSRLGYRVLALSNPRQALDVFRETPDEFDVVVTDEMMPEIRGTDLLAEIRAIRPGMPVILYSGFAAALRNKPKEEYPFDAFVMKPMVVSELTKAIRAVTAGHARSV